MTDDPRRNRLYRPTFAGEVLDGLTRRMGVRERLEQHRIWSLWNDLVGAPTAAHAQPVRLRGGVLEVRVDHPVWMQQLQLLKPRIIQRINQALAPLAIQDIHWLHGRMPEIRRIEANQLPPPSSSLTTSQQAYLDRLLPEDGDELHLAWRKLLMQHLSSEKNRK